MARIQELEGELLEAQGAGAARRPRIALGMVVEKQAPGHVLEQWLGVLRRHYWPGPTFPHRAYDVVEARNRITAMALELPAEAFEAFYWTDSDMVPDPGVVDRLEQLVRSPEFRAKNGGVIVGAYYGREQPFEIQLFQPRPEHQGMRYLPPAQWVPLLMEAHKRYLALEPGRLIPVGGGGTGSMLIRRDVLERMQALKGRGKVWELHPVPDKVLEAIRTARGGEDRPGGMWTEDVWFCIEAAQRLGIQVLADTDLRLTSGHLRYDVVGPDHYLAAHAVPDRVMLDQGALERAGYAVTSPAVRS